MREPLFAVVTDETTPDVLVIRDVGDHTFHPTITNGAEAVLFRLWQAGVLTPGRRVLYYDSEGELAELLWRGRGTFVGFGSVGQ